MRWICREGVGSLVRWSVVSKGEKYVCGGDIRERWKGGGCCEGKSGLVLKGRAKEVGFYFIVYLFGRIYVFGSW